MVQEFFTSLFAVEGTGDISTVIRGVFPTVWATTMEEILSPFTKDEIRSIVFAISPYKAASPDGLMRVLSVVLE